VGAFSSGRGGQAPQAVEPLSGGAPPNPTSGVEAIQAIARRAQMTEIAWRLILALCAEVGPTDEHVAVMIGTGPIYDYIHTEGPKGLERIERAAAEHPMLVQATKFAHSRDPRVDERIVAFLAAHGTERDKD
jgi:hypothetical protein